MLLYILTLIADITMLVITGVRILDRARHLEHSEQAYFDEERKNFWIYVKLFAMMFITWPAEVSTYLEGYFLEVLLVTDAIKFLTAVVILVVVLDRKKVQILLFEKYRNFADI